MKYFWILIQVYSNLFWRQFCNQRTKDSLTLRGLLNTDCLIIITDNPTEYHNIVGHIRISMATSYFFLLQIVETIDCAFHLINNHLFNTFLTVHGKRVTRSSIFVMNKSWTFKLRVDMLLTYSGHCALSRFQPTPQVKAHQSCF